MSEKIVILGIGISIQKTDGLIRFENFCKEYNLPYKIVGEGEKWLGGDMEKGPGGGQKIKKLLEVIENLENQLIVVCDTFDLIPIARIEEIVEKYHSICPNNEVLFSSEVFCWPDKYLAKKYPIVQTKYKYLNSGSFIGYRDDIYRLITDEAIANTDDDQRFFTKKYLDGKKKIILDRECHLFQAINGAKEDLTLYKNRIYNKYTKSYPVFIHGNGPSKLFLNHLENQLELNLERNYSFSLIKNHQLQNEPKIFFALYVDSSKDMRFYHFLRNVLEINYHNKEIHIYDKNQNEEIRKEMEDRGYYYYNSNIYQFSHFLNSDADYYFLLEERCIINKKDVLQELVPLCTGYKRVIAPLLIHKTKSLFTNFWGQLDSNGYYARSSDYLDLVKGTKVGLWNVPYVSGALLIDRNIICDNDLLKEKMYQNDNDMNLCYNLRRRNIFMYVVNHHAYGYLVD